MLRYPFDTLTVLSRSTLLTTLSMPKGNVEGLSMNEMQGQLAESIS